MNETLYSSILIGEIIIFLFFAVYLGLKVQSKCQTCNKYH